MNTDISRSTALTLTVAVLCIVGIGLAAATLDSAEGDSDSGMGFEPPQSGDTHDPGTVDNGSGSGNVSSVRGGSVSLSTCYEPLSSTPGTVIYLLGFVAAVGGIYVRHGFSIALFGSWTLTPPLMLVYFLLTNCPSSNADGGGSSASSAGGFQGGAGLSIGQVPPWMLGVVVVGVLVFAVGLLYRSFGDDEIVTLAEEDAEDEPHLDRFAEAAGRAADRIEEHNEDVENAVYRAWLEMTSLLDVERPETHSPGEFAEEAIELGMAEADVRELTRLFDEVRYGGMEPEEREERAVAVLRNIESEYGEATDADLVENMDSGPNTDETDDTTEEEADR